jgi:hypothetical protein
VFIRANPWPTFSSINNQKSTTAKERPHTQKTRARAELGWATLESRSVVGGATRGNDFRLGKAGCDAVELTLFLPGTSLTPAPRSNYFLCARPALLTEVSL